MKRQLTRVAASIVLGTALAGAMAGPVQAAESAQQAADRHGNMEGTYGSRGACVDAGRSGQRRHRWYRFDCDRRDDRSHDRRDDRRDGRHHDGGHRGDRDDWVLRVYR